MGYCEVVPSIYVAVASLQSKPQDENICAVFEWVEPNEEIQARDCVALSLVSYKRCIKKICVDGIEQLLLSGENAECLVSQNGVSANCHFVLLQMILSISDYCKVKLS